MTVLHLKALTFGGRLLLLIDETPENGHRLAVRRNAILSLTQNAALSPTADSPEILSLGP